MASDPDIDQSGIDLALVQRAQQGDLKALEQLLKRQRDRLRQLIQAHGLSVEETRTMISRVEGKVRKHLPEFRGRSVFARWVDSIAYVMTDRFIQRRDQPDLALPA